MKVSKNILEVDQAIQTLIIGLAATTAVLAIISPSILVYYLLLQLAMGFWQVCSAFIIAMISGNIKRLQYLLAVVAYFVQAGLISYLMKDYVFESEIAMAIVWIGVPIIYALWYFKITRDDVKSLKNNKTLENIFDSKEYV